MAYSQKCAQCSGRLGLGLRFRNYWQRWTGWTHVRFCSSWCQDLYEVERSQRDRWHRFLQGSS